MGTYHLGAASLPKVKLRESIEKYILSMFGFGFDSLKNIHIPVINYLLINLLIFANKLNKQLINNSE